MQLTYKCSHVRRFTAADSRRVWVAWVVSSSIDHHARYSISCFGLGERPKVLRIVLVYHLGWQGACWKGSWFLGWRWHVHRFILKLRKKTILFWIEITTQMFTHEIIRIAWFLDKHRRIQTRVGHILIDRSIVVSGHIVISDWRSVSEVPIFGL